MSVEGVRKDNISHGIRSAILKAGGYPTYFNDMRQKLPTKFADMVSKYIPQEIEQTTNVQHNVLVVNMPEPRQVLDIPCEVRAIDNEPPAVKAATDAPERSMNNVLLDRQGSTTPDNEGDTDG